MMETMIPPQVGLRLRMKKREAKEAQIKKERERPQKKEKGQRKREGQKNINK